MKTVLVAVDDIRGSAPVLAVFRNLVRPPEEVVLLHVQRLEGDSLIIDMLGEAELATLRESLAGTEHQERLDRKAEQVLAHYRREFESRGLIRVRTLCRSGIPAEEILKAAEEVEAELILLGCGPRRGLDRIIGGCLSSELQREAAVPVVVARRAPVAGRAGSLLGARLATES